MLIDYDLFVRQPGQATQKYTVKTYDEPTVSSMVHLHLFGSHQMAY